METVTRTQWRSQLGDFSSIVCFKAVIVGVEEALGAKAAAIALTTAGRVRGKQLASSLGLDSRQTSLAEAESAIRQALGPEGTRLLILEKIAQDGEVLRIYTRETVCSAGEPEGSPRKCTFTLGAIWGALEVLMGRRYLGRQIDSVLQGGQYDTFELTPIA